MTKLLISALWRYPIKSCAGEKLEVVQVSKRGFEFDRRWLVVDENGMFVSQRGEGGLGIGIKTMCLVQPRIDSDGYMVVNAPRMPPLWLPVSTKKTEQCDVQVWNTSCKAIEVSKGCSDWFTEFLSRERPGTYRLVQIADDFVRTAKKSKSELAFADGYPFLIVSEASLQAVNDRIEGEPVPMDRFRPNIVLSGCNAHEEDEMKIVFVDGIVFSGQKLCDRCSIPAYNQATAEIDSRPLGALAQYRRWANDDNKMKVWFGRNFTHHGTGSVRVGSVVEILS